MTHPDDEPRAVLARGELTVVGRLSDASNATLVAVARLDGAEVFCVYKPVRGERPLWDFPEATLGRREVAAYELSRWAGFDVVPPTVLREGPLGEGSVQAWIDSGERDPDGDPVPPEAGAGLIDLLRPQRIPQGWLTVLEGEDVAGRPVALAHADAPVLRVMAAFDSVANNADRKAGHVLADDRSRVRGVDHGLTFNVDHKLRTVLWGFGGRPLGDDLLGALERLVDGLGPEGGAFARLCPLLSREEIRITRDRARRLWEIGEFPLPMEGHPAVPWPLF